MCCSAYPFGCYTNPYLGPLAVVFLMAGADSDISGHRHFDALRLVRRDAHDDLQDINNRIKYI